LSDWDAPSPRARRRGVVRWIARLPFRACRKALFLSRRFIKYCHKAINYRLYARMAALEHALAHQHGLLRNVDNRLDDFIGKMTFHFWNSLPFFNETSETLQKEINQMRAYLMAFEYAFERERVKLDDHLVAMANPSEPIRTEPETERYESRCAYQNERAA
jgi:hypothetical protein